MRLPSKKNSTLTFILQWKSFTRKKRQEVHCHGKLLESSSPNFASDFLGSGLPEICLEIFLSTTLRYPGQPFSFMSSTLSQISMNVEMVSPIVIDLRIVITLWAVINAGVDLVTLAMAKTVFVSGSGHFSWLFIRQTGSSSGSEWHDSQLARKFNVSFHTLWDSVWLVFMARRAWFGHLSATADHHPAACAQHPKGPFDSN